MAVTWKAPDNVQEMLDEIKTSHHSELNQASIVVAFADTAPFLNNQFNYGKVSKFSDFAKIWQKEVYDYCIVVSADVWHSILKPDQQKALLDLHLCRCQPEYEPEVVVQNGKKTKVKDEWGRVKYTNEVKLDDDGKPKWKLLPLDLQVFAQNFSRHGLWCEDMTEFGQTIGLSSPP